MDELYDEDFFANRKRYHSKIENAVRILMRREFMWDVQTIIDIGCGDAHWLKCMSALPYGKSVIGLEKNASCLPYTGNIPIIIHDLENELDLWLQFDAVLCLEVAEHLPEEAAPMLVELCSRITRSHLIFSAAPPGQGGVGHVNLQPQIYWLELFKENDMLQWGTETDYLRKEWHDAGVMSWLVDNVMVLRNVWSDYDHSIGNW